jgi:hypothetical protein
MRAQRIALALSVINLGILFVAMTQVRPSATSADGGQVLRGRSFEIVDEQGQVRSSLRIEPDGEVVFRLFDKNGTIRVKLGANESGSGLLLADETTEPGVHMIARRVGTADRPNTTRVTLTGAGGKQRVVEP